MPIKLQPVNVPKKEITSLARGTRPWTEVTTDQTSVDMFRTTVSEAPARVPRDKNILVM